MRRLAPWLAAGLAALASTVFVLTTRLPMPFPGFGIAAGAVLASLGTLALMAWMPTSWLWSDRERLLRAFRARHGLSDQGAENAIAAVATAHERAIDLRRRAAGFQQDIADQVARAADQLDAAAKEIFYAPERLRPLQRVLVRSELIEEAVASHAALRQRASENAGIAETSRQELARALAALDTAFQEVDQRAMRGHLTAVETASDVAEQLLAPRAGRL